jgi:hypothetical protein
MHFYLGTVARMSNPNINRLARVTWPAGSNTDLAGSDMEADRERDVEACTLAYQRQ